MKKVLIIDCGSSKVPALEEILKTNSVDFITLKLNQLETIENYRSIIISGAPILFTEIAHDFYLEKAKIIFSKSQIPVLGVCFGHQLMGVYHGAEVSRCNESRSWEKINFIGSFTLFPYENTQIELFEDHCECISLPTGFVLKASSATAVNEAMEHATNPWYGVQFHPEVSGVPGAELILNFINLSKPIH